MDVKQLQYFVVSVDMGSFNAAAEVLITTQPNVSKIVKSLEQELGMVLLERNRNGVTITPEGEHVYIHAIDVLDNIKNIRTFSKSKDIHKLSISSIQSKEVAMYISEFYNQNKSENLNFKIDFYETEVEEIIKRIHTRKSELGFVYISRRNMPAFEYNIKSKGLEFYELSKSQLYLFVGKKNKFYNNDYINEKHLSEIRLVQYYERQYSLYNHLGHIKEDIMYNQENCIISYTNSEYFLSQLVKHTEYGTISTSWNLKGNEEDGIRSIKILPYEKDVAFGYIKRSKNNLSQICGEFVHFIKENISNRK